MTLTKDDLYNAQYIWKTEKRRLYDCEEIYYAAPEDIYHFRKLKRHRENALPGAIAKEYNSRIHGRRKSRAGHRYPAEFFEKGQEKWDALQNILKMEGWLSSCPARLMFSNKNRRAKLIDGHHRLPIAIQLKIAIIPLKIRYIWKEI